MEHEDLILGMEVALNMGVHCMSKPGKEIPNISQAVIVDTMRLSRLRKGSGFHMGYKPNPLGQFLRVRHTSPSPRESGHTYPTSYVSIRKILGPWGEVEATNDVRIGLASKAYLTEKADLETALSTLTRLGIPAIGTRDGEGEFQVSFSLAGIKELLRMAAGQPALSTTD